MRIAQLRQRLRDLGAKPCHEDRLLRGWSQVCSYDRPRSAAEGFFPLALRNELPAIEAELFGLARLRSEYPANGHGSHDRSPTLLRQAQDRPSLPPRKPSPQPSDGTAGHSTRPSENNGQVAGHPACGESEARGAEPSKRVKHCSIPAGEGANVALRAFSNNEGVARLLVELADGQMVESVLLPRGGLCVSTQVGCAVGCVFCMSGRAGLQRQLGSAEIVAQVVLARRRRAVSKVVFMGMGEPAHNLDNVCEAIQLLGTQGNIGHKNLVFSTVGDLRVFERLPQEKVKPALAVSLHSTDAELRAELLPRAPQIAIEELVGRAEVYARATSYPVQYQWTLLEGINDSDAEVERIAQLLSGKYAVMNFIPFNAVDGLDYRRPSSGRIAAMVHNLKQRGILAKIRDSAGQEIEGACGQLRARAVKAS